MNLVIDTKQDILGNLVITDTTGFGTDGFLPEDQEYDPLNLKYKVSDVIFHIKLMYHSSTGIEEVASARYHISPLDVDDDYPNVIYSNPIPIKKDGHYSLYYFIVPLETRKDLLQKSTVYYGTVGGTIYDGDGNTVFWQDIDFTKDSTIISFITDLFSIFILKNVFQQYIKKSILGTQPEIYGYKNRDITPNVIGSALQSITYLLGDYNFLEAQLIIEGLYACNLWIT